jgi:hypothetical protein
MPSPAGFRLPTTHHPAPDVRDLPTPPERTWRLIGPGLIASGVGLASGEFVLWPFIASQVGLVFLWGMVFGVSVQWFLNLEIERYTLATGETALTGFSRLWRHWGLAFVVLVLFANAWPGWATSSATLLTYVTGGNVAAITVAMLIAAGAILTLAPVVYTALERVVTVKLVVIGGFFVLALALVVPSASWAALATAVTHAGRLPDLDVALLVGAIAFAGAGGGQNLCQSNWVRDKGFGMGAHIPHLVSPLTGEPTATAAARAVVFPPTEANLARWSRWWRFACLEQALAFALVTAVTIVLTSVLAHATLFGRPGLPNGIDFLRLEGDALAGAVGGWFGSLFWLIGAYSLFAATVGIIDYSARLAADVLKGTYLRARAISESGVYGVVVWGLVLTSVAIVGLGVRQPLALLVVSACTGALMMGVYAILLIVLNTTTLPAAIAPTRWRVSVLAVAALFFGWLSVLILRQQLGW